jgi:hypothetical protein
MSKKRFSGGDIKRTGRSKKKEFFIRYFQALHNGLNLALSRDELLSFAKTTKQSYIFYFADWAKLPPILSFQIIAPSRLSDRISSDIGRTKSF